MRFISFSPEGRPATNNGVETRESNTLVSLSPFLTSDLWKSSYLPYLPLGARIFLSMAFLLIRRRRIILHGNDAENVGGWGRDEGNENVCPRAIAPKAKAEGTFVGVPWPCFAPFGMPMTTTFFRLGCP